MTGVDMNISEIQKIAQMVLQGDMAVLVADSTKSDWRNPSFTSSASKFLKEEGAMSIQDDVSTIIFRRLMSGNCCSSSGWFSLLFSCRLAIAGSRSRLPISSIVRGFMLANSATSKMIAIEGMISCDKHSHLLKLSWNNLEDVMRVVDTSLRSRRVLQLTEQQISHVGILLLTAFLSSADKDNMRCSVMYKQSWGLPIENMIVHENTLLMDIPIPSILRWPCGSRSESKNCRIPFKDLIVAIFEGSLELSEFPGYQLEIDTINDMTMQDGSVKSLEYRFLENMASVIRQSKVTLVACQRRIHPYLVRILQRDGIVSLSRLSIRFCGALQRLCGARQLVTFPLSRDMRSAIDPSCLGYLAYMEYRTIYGKKYVVVSSRCKEGSAESGTEINRMRNFVTSDFNPSVADEIESRQSTMSTVTLTAPSELLCCELEIACEETVRTLSSLLSCPYVLRGKGLWQRSVARELRGKLASSLHCESTRTLNPLCVGSSSDVIKAAGIYIDCLNYCGVAMSGEEGLGECDTYDDVASVWSDTKDARHFLRTQDNPRNSGNIKSQCPLSDDDDEYMEDDNEDPGSAFHVKNTAHMHSLEALVTNRIALQQAVDAAVCILDMDERLTLHPVEINKDNV